MKTYGSITITDVTDGRGIASITNYYYATETDTETLPDTGDAAWKENVSDLANTFGSTYKYLWNYEDVTYSDDTSFWTDPIIIGTYGAEGRGIESITEYYMGTSSPSTPTRLPNKDNPNTSNNGWYKVSDSFPTSIIGYQFIWKCEIVRYTDGTATVSAPACVGLRGGNGATGNGIKTTVTEYHLSDNAETEPASDSTGWTTDIKGLNWTPTNYIWQRDKITYTNNTTAYKGVRVDKALSVVASWCDATDSTVIDGAKIATGSITATQIASNAITADKIVAGAVTADKIGANAVTADKIQAGAITTGKIAADAVTTENIVAGAITAAEIATGAITTDKIQAGAITANEIQALSIETQHIQSKAITSALIDAAAIQASHIEARTIPASHIYFHTITTDCMAADSISSSQIQADSIGTEHIQANAVTATEINVDDLSACAAKIANWTISEDRIYTDGVGLYAGNEVTYASLSNPSSESPIRWYAGSGDGVENPRRTETLTFCSTDGWSQTHRIEFDTNLQPIDIKYPVVYEVSSGEIREPVEFKLTWESTSYEGSYTLTDAYPSDCTWISVNFENAGTWRPQVEYFDGDIIVSAYHYEEAKTIIGTLVYEYGYSENLEIYVDSGPGYIEVELWPDIINHEYVIDIEYLLDFNNRNFMVLEDGSVYARNALITGTVYATNGRFEGEVRATSGVFNGAIYAESGNFKGTIEAESGQIGDLKFNKGQITSSNGMLSLLANGTIVAKNLEIKNQFDVANISANTVCGKGNNPAYFSFGANGTEYVEIEVTVNSEVLDEGSDGVWGFGFKSGEVRHTIALREKSTGLAFVTPNSETFNLLILYNIKIKKTI